MKLLTHQPETSCDMESLVDTEDLKLLTVSNERLRFLENLDSICQTLHSLSIFKEPEGKIKVYTFNEFPNRDWGRVSFAHLASLSFFKAFYCCPKNERNYPFGDLSFKNKILFNAEASKKVGLSCPKLLGAFSIKQDNEWLWNGLIMEYLEGWRTLDRKDLGDIKLAEEAVDQMTKLGVYDEDFHQKNIMTDGNGNWKIVDLDQMRFYRSSPEESRKQMMEKFLMLDI